MDPKITIVMVLRDVPREMVERTVGAIRNQSVFCKAIIVSFGSKNYEWEKGIIPSKNIKLVHVEERTKHFDISRALNIGIKQAKTEYVMLSDIDIVLDDNFIEVVTDILNGKHPVVPEKWTLLCLRRDLKSIDSNSWSCGKRSCYGSCTIIERDWLLKVHGMDERFVGLGMSDVDLVDRAVRDGYQIVWIHGQTSIYHQYHPKRNKPMMKKNIEYDKISKQVVRNPSGWGNIK